MVDARQVSADSASGPSPCFEERAQRGFCMSSCCPCEKSLICVEAGWSSWEPTSHESSQWSPESANCQSRITWPHGGMTRRKKQSWEEEAASSGRRLGKVQDWKEADGEVWSKRPGINHIRWLVVWPAEVQNQVSCAECPVESVSQVSPEIQYQCDRAYLEQGPSDQFHGRPSRDRGTDLGTGTRVHCVGIAGGERMRK